MQSGKVVSRCDRVLRFDHGTDRRFAGPDWSPNRFKAECAPLGAIAGLSTTPGTNEVRAALCTASDASRFGSTRSACTARSFAAGDARGTSSSGDWAPGYLKGECADGEYVAGVSQSPDRYLVSILLCTRDVERTASHPLAAADVAGYGSIQFANLF